MLEGLRSDAITFDALVNAHEARVAEHEPVVQAWCRHEPPEAAAQVKALGSGHWMRLARVDPANTSLTGCES